MNNKPINIRGNFMQTFGRDLEDDACPVSDHVLAQLCRADEHSLPGLLDAIERKIKPALAFFCYRRAHLQTVGLQIAASCEEGQLISFAGPEAGTALFGRAREKCPFVQTRHYPFRRKITLATGPIWSTPFEQEADEPETEAIFRDVS